MIRVEWLGTDGSVWDLRDGEVRLALGSNGWGLVPLTTFTQDNGMRDGQRATGWKAEPQTFVWPLKKGFLNWSSRDWYTVDKAWWKACQPHKSGTIRVTAPDGGQRTVAARVTSDGPYGMDYDPSDVNAEDFTLNLTADLPWWLGQQVTAQYGTATPSPFYGPSGFGPPFYISAANSQGLQTIANPGDVDAWPVWTLLGPVSAFAITATDSTGQHVVSGSPALALGESLVIDTRPGAKIANRYAADGTPTNWTPNLTAWDWRSIPAGSSTPFSVALTGSGIATAAIQPRYFRAW